MKKSIKKKWVAALRSGQYKQGFAQLRSEEGFCCLGVLCNLHAKAHPEIAARQTDPDSYLGGSFFLPEEVQAWAGLKQESGAEVIFKGHTKTLDELNDGRGCEKQSFRRIATIIEKQL